MIGQRNQGQRLYVATRFGGNVSRHRRESGISQEELGYRASLHRTEIGLLERGGRTARIDTALQVAGGLELPLVELIDGIEWRCDVLHRGRFHFE